MKNRWLSYFVWAVISALRALGFAQIALIHDESVSAWLLVAAVCTCNVSYRFYSRFMAQSL